jgi:hypothetical protein
MLLLLLGESSIGRTFQAFILILHSLERRNAVTAKGGLSLWLLGGRAFSGWIPNIQPSVLL